jgi:ankyrin repeat protein
LFWAIGRIRNDVTPEKQMQIFRMLLKAGADPNMPAASDYRYTPLIDAASLGQAEIARVLLDAGADVKATNKVGQTALHLVGDKVEVAKVLLVAGADIKARDSSGLTPVDYAIRDANTNTLGIFTNASARINR